MITCLSVAKLIPFKLEGTMKKTTEERFFEKIEKKDCWEWTAKRDRQDYGILKVDGKNRKAHRVSWVIHFGNIPENMCVLHKCDNTCCVNPEHLFLGTVGDNNKDRELKGRGGQLKGEEQGLSKLTEKQVLEIRDRYEKEDISQEQLGIEYGVSQGHIGYIIRKEKWSWL